MARYRIKITRTELVSKPTPVEWVQNPDGKDGGDAVDMDGRKGAWGWSKNQPINVVEEELVILEMVRGRLDLKAVVDAIMAQPEEGEENG